MHCYIKKKKHILYLDHSVTIDKIIPSKVKKKRNSSSKETKRLKNLSLKINVTEFLEN